MGKVVYFKRWMEMFWKFCGMDRTLSAPVAVKKAVIFSVDYNNSNAFEVLEPRRKLNIVLSRRI